ncbi:MAG: AbrB/MazE/SpoVT family DNA-binding domain-containing protein [Candidatus Kariarchaeaceae archaeon]
MEAQTIKISEKGQIVIPKSIRDRLGLMKGDTLNIIRDGSIIILEKIDKERYEDLTKHAEKVVKRIWDNEHDKIWDTL